MSDLAGGSESVKRAIVNIIGKIDHFAQKFKMEIITLLYSAKHAENVDIFYF